VFGRIYRRPHSKTLWVAYSIDGREVRESSHSTRWDEANALLQQRHDEHRGIIPTKTPTSVNDLLDDLLLDYEINQKSSQWVKLVNDCHLRPAFGKLRADDLSTAALNAYIAQRRKKGIKNSTINRELSLLRRAYTLGHRCDPPKVTRVPRIPKLAEHNVRKGFFEAHEFTALYNALPAHLRPVLLFAYHTGTRRGEILSLRWTQVDLTHHIVRLEPGTTKNKDARLIPLTPELHATLQQLAEHRDPNNPYVFTYHGKPIKTFNNSWVVACKAAGLTDANGKPTKLFHDLRRTGVRNLVRAGVPELIAMKISGHRTRSVFDRYNITTEEDLHNAAAVLANYLRCQNNAQ
jgi:integrase